MTTSDVEMNNCPEERHGLVVICQVGGFLQVKKSINLMNFLNSFINMMVTQHENNIE